MLEGLPGVLIVADQLGHHHDFVPVVVDLDLRDALLLEHVEGFLHDLDADILELDGCEGGFGLQLLLKYHVSVLLIENLRQIDRVSFVRNEVAHSCNLLR